MAIGILYSGKGRATQKPFSCKILHLPKIALEMRHLDMCPLMSCTKNQGKDVIPFDWSGQTSRLKIPRYYQLELSATLTKNVRANVPVCKIHNMD